MDGFRYFIGETTDPLFERWFYCDDLGSQLLPVIKEFFASEEYRTGRPIPGSSIPDKLPYHVDFQRKVQEPFNLATWLQCNKPDIKRNGVKNLFAGEILQSEVLIYGTGINDMKPVQHEIWLWQLVKRT